MKTVRVRTYRAHIELREDFRGGQWRAILSVNVFGVIRVEVEMDLVWAASPEVTDQWARLCKRFDVQWRTLPAADRTWAALGLMARVTEALRKDLHSR